MKKKKNNQPSPAETLSAPPAERTSRRSFFRKTWHWLLLIAGVEGTAVGLSFLGAGRKKQQKKAGGTFTEIATVEDVPKGSVFPYRAGRLYVCHLDDDGFLAVSIRCTHLGCSIEWDKEKQEFLCPCHHSMFDIRGDVLNPPATRPLDYYPLKIEKGKILVDLSRPVTRKHFTPSQETYA
jgi:cytochrome b6-f complex iron-sulfur subunit